MKILGKIFTFLISMIAIGLWIFAGLMHIWTIYIAYHSFGAFWGIVNLFFPVVSEIIIGYIAYKNFGFESPYLQWLIVLLIFWLVYLVVLTISASVSSYLEKKSKAL